MKEIFDTLQRKEQNSSNVLLFVAHVFKTKTEKVERLWGSGRRFEHFNFWVFFFCVISVSNQLETDHSLVRFFIFILFIAIELV